MREGGLSGKQGSHEHGKEEKAEIYARHLEYYPSTALAGLEHKP